MKFSLSFLFLFLSFSPLALAERGWPLRTIEATSLSLQSNPQREVIIAIIDTGIDYNHKTLNSMLWHNAGETGLDDQGQDKSVNGKDDDQNGFIDDLHGWNFINSSTSLEDHHGHGTHIAGIIASVSAGEFPARHSRTDIKLMILKYYDANASAASTMKNTVLAIDYAIQNGAQIINYSGGGLHPNSEEKAALKRASDAGVLVVAAAGNESANSDVVGYYPANYDLPNILSVGGIDSDLKIVESSNHGVENVDIAAPGENIASTLPNKTFGIMTGTSQATAFTSAVAALVISERAYSIKPSVLISHLKQSGSFNKNLVGRIKSSAVLNAKRSVQMSVGYELANLIEVENYKTSTEKLFVKFLSPLTTDLQNQAWPQEILTKLGEKNLPPLGPLKVR